MNNGNFKLKLFWILIVNCVLSIVNLSCTHWIIDTETRIRMYNDTDIEIRNLSLISEDKRREVLIPETVKPDESSNAYENGWVGEFHFAIFSRDSLIDLGVHKLKGGAVQALIRKENDKFFMRLK